MRVGAGISKAGRALTFGLFGLALLVVGACAKQTETAEETEDCWLLSPEALAAAQADGRCRDAFAGSDEGPPAKKP